MALSKKHYEQFAHRFAQQNEELGADKAVPFAEQVRASKHLKALAEKMAIDFALDNPNFKRDVFLKACGF
jgi:hypothetical protein